ncbi:MAG: glutaredoxin family protein [Verrucomicrobiales bacterium]|jgi:glutaredoxin|nr:glutaredoxin family protein [Verrucomicrobiales bacterium]
MNKAKIYVKTGCPWCEEALAFLDSKKIPYEKIVVSGNPAAMNEMIELSGQSKAPTLDWNGEVLADFGVDELVPFLKARDVL